VVGITKVGEISGKERSNRSLENITLDMDRERRFAKKALKRVTQEGVGRELGADRDRSQKEEDFYEKRIVLCIVLAKGAYFFPGSKEQEGG
jgi:hypothetical protein